MVYSASAVMADERYGQPYLFLIKQLMWAIARCRPPRRGHADRLPQLPRAGVHLVVLRHRVPGPRRGPVQPRSVTSARRWFSIGGLGIQPSELAKLSAIVFIAALLERRMHRINDVSYALAPDQPGRGASSSV